MTNFLITGGSGFVGTHLSEFLLNDGFGVIIYDIHKPKIQHSNLTYIQGDILDELSLMDAISNVDVVIHLASMIGILRAIKIPETTLNTNTIGTKNVLNACLKNNKEILLGSSSMIYGKNPDVPMNEETDIVLGNLNVLSWTYAISKLTQEAFALAYCREHNLNVKIFRLFNNIGPGQSYQLGNVVPSFIENLKNGKPIEIHGNGDQTRTFIDVRDTAKAIYLIYSKGKTGEIYNVGGEEEMSILELGQHICTTAGIKFECNFIEKSSVFGRNYEEPLRRIPDITKLKKIGYTQTYSFKKSLQSIIEEANLEYEQ